MAASCAAISALSSRAGLSGLGCSNDEYGDELHSVCDTVGGIYYTWFQMKTLYIKVLLWASNTTKTRLHPLEKLVCLHTLSWGMTLRRRKELSHL